MSVSTWDDSAKTCAVVRAMHTAQPTMTQRELGANLGMNRALVAYYLGRKTKGPGRELGPWSDQLMRACLALKEGRNTEAAREFYQLAQDLSYKPKL